MNDLVSIVVPAYNAEAYIKETIDSLLSQTYQPLEIIVVNDGSKDRSAEIARSYGDRLIFIDQKNQGQASALNNGWTQAKGRWIGYLSADDLLYPEAISKLVSALQAGSDVVYPDYDLIDASSKKIREQRAPDFNLGDLVLRLICQPGPGALFSRSLFESTQGWDLSFRQMPDFDFWLQCAVQASFQRVPETLAAFRIHEESQTYMSPSAPKSEEPVRALEKFFARGASSFSKRERRLALGFAHVTSARLHARASRYTDVLRHLWSAVRLAPVLLIQPRVWRLLAGGLFGKWRYRLRAIKSAAS